MAQLQNETAIEYLRRVVEQADEERESVIDDLPSLAAITDFIDLWQHYGTDFWDGILECIAEGDDPTAARNFVRKHKLPKYWEGDINDSVRSST